MANIQIKYKAMVKNGQAFQNNLFMEVSMILCKDLLTNFYELKAMILFQYYINFSKISACSLEVTNRQF